MSGTFDDCAQRTMPLSDAQNGAESRKLRSNDSTPAVDGEVLLALDDYDPKVCPQG
jgi:hypothetical protein